MSTSNDEKPARLAGRLQPPKSWLKLWRNFLGCTKFEEVAARPRVTATARNALQARYTDLLICALEQQDSGKLPAVAQMAFALHLEVEEMLKTLDDLIDCNLIELRGKSYWIHDWDQWQEKRSYNAERQKRYRDKRNALRNVSRNALRNAPVTRDVTDNVTRSVTRDHSRAEENPPPEEGGGSLPKAPPAGESPEGGGRASLGATPVPPPRVTGGGGQTISDLELKHPPLRGPTGEVISQAENAAIMRRMREEANGYGVDEAKARRRRQL